LHGLRFLVEAFLRQPFNLISTGSAVGRRFPNLPVSSDTKQRCLLTSQLREVRVVGSHGRYPNAIIFFHNPTAGSSDGRVRGIRRHSFRIDDNELLLRPTLQQWALVYGAGLHTGRNQPNDQDQRDKTSYGFHTFLLWNDGN
jgi:hypothetical protein